MRFMDGIFIQLSHTILVMNHLKAYPIPAIKNSESSDIYQPGLGPRYGPLTERAPESH